jgi:hypothetical protein
MILLVIFARGCGSMKIELRPVTAQIDLINGLASGLV